MSLRRAGAALIVCGVIASAGLPAEAAALRVRDRLAWSRPDGTPVAFRPEVHVWCGRWDDGIPVRSIHVRVGPGLRPRWELHAVVADVKRHPVLRLPHSFVFDHPTGALLYATAGATNEVNSDTDESRGRIRFLRVSCGRRLHLAFRLNGRLGSELSDGEPLLVRGSFSASG